MSFSLDLQISKYCGFDFEIKKRIQEPPNPVQKLGLVSCIHYTLPQDWKLYKYENLQQILIQVQRFTIN